MHLCLVQLFVHSMIIKKMKKLLLGLFIGLGMTTGIAYASTVLSVPQGGTGLQYPTTGFQSGKCLIGNGLGAIGTTTCGGAYPFPLTGNATSTLTQFNGGTTAFASSTIGNGTQTGGLTISGGATTTGNAYFAGNVSVGTTDPRSRLDVVDPGTGGVATIQNTNVAGYSAVDLYSNTAKIGGLGFGNPSTGAPYQGSFYFGTDSTNPFVFLTNSTERLRISGTGFGTTTVTGFTVNGSATSTSNVGVNITGGCYAVGGNCISGGSSGSGLSSYDAFTHPAAGQSATTSLMMFNGNASTTQISANTGFFNSILATSTTVFSGFGATTTPFAQLSVNSVAGSPAFVIGSSTATSFIVDKSGNVGVGTANPGVPLDVTGSARVSVSLSSPVITSQGSAITIQPGTDVYSENVVFKSASGVSLLGFDTGNQKIYVHSNLAVGYGLDSTNQIAARAYSPGIALTDLNYTTGINTLRMFSTGTDGTFALGVGANNNTNTHFVLKSSGYIGIGTTTPSYLLNPFSSTAPQLALSAGAGIAQWTARNAGGNFYLSTTTVDGTATSTQISPFEVRNSGAVYAPFAASSGASQTGYWCYDTNGQLIRDTAVCLVSARKFKTDIKPLTVGLEDLNKMNFVSYLKKEPLSAEDSHRQMGVIADDVASISPQLNEMLVTYVGGGTSGEVHAFRYDQFTALLGQSIKDLNAKVDSIQVGKVARSAEENWQNIAIGLLALGFIYQQFKIRKLTK